MIRRLGVCSSSSHTLVGSQPGGCSFSAPWFLSGCLVLVKMLDWQQRWKRRRRPFFLIKLYVSVHACVFWTPPTTTTTLCPSQTPTPPLLSPLTHINAHPSSETERRKEFILPVPAISVKLIRLWAPDNGIISDSFNNTNPPSPPMQLQTLQSHNITTHYCISKFTLLTRTSRVNWHSAWRAKHLALPQTRWGIIFELSCTYTTFLFILCSCFTSALA